MNSNLTPTVESLEPWKGTYWTCFFNAGRDVTKFHVTHKYFGSLDKMEVDDVHYIIDAFFEVNPMKAMTIHFGVEDRFDDVPGSGDGLIKVFKTDDSQIQDHYGVLRDSFVPYAKDTYPLFQPHLSGPEASTITLDRYALCCDDEVLKVWELKPTE